MEDSDPRDVPALNNDKGYALSGKIMLTAIVILFFVVLMMVCLHLYARWYLLHARRRQIRRNRQRRTHLVFYVDPSNSNPVAIASRGLDAAVLKSLPVFVYNSKTHPDPLDCAVCLSEFQENETGRTLPKCNHSFHVGCIDMWFHSHSTCPLCRTLVEPCPWPSESENRAQVVIPVIEPGSSSGLCDTCRHEDEDESVGTSSNNRGKPREHVSVTIEVPMRLYNEGFENESIGRDSPSGQTHSQSSFRSPVSRMLSFKRILSRERRGNPSPTSASCGGCVAESDIELGRDREETRQTQS